jgi:hypothetical protein
MILHRFIASAAATERLQSQAALRNIRISGITDWFELKYSNSGMQVKLLSAFEIGLSDTGS